jgi:peptidoglycan/LPS O-acetylase OafA/YrhL
LLRRHLEYAYMNDQSRSPRRILAAIGLGFVALSIAMTFVAPGTFWNWGLLLVALAFVFLSRRAA